MRIFYSLLIFFLLQTTAFAQFSADTVSAQPGDNISLNIAFHIDMQSDTGYSITGTFILKNPSVFYPVQFGSSKDSIIKEQRIDRFNDSLYQFFIKFINVKDTVLNFRLLGKTLAGYDSVCAVEFSDIYCNGKKNDNFTGYVKSLFYYGFIPYIRFADIKDCYPNPVTQNESTTWEYMIDKNSDITFSIYDLNGKLMNSVTIYDQKAGEHKYTVYIDVHFTSGKYYLFFSSNTSSYHKEFVVVR